MSLSTKPFIIRVYGIAIHHDRILVCDEYWFDTPMTKFPGGGLEYGEGTLDCLKRECFEELDQEVTILSHYYTTDFFQATRFIPGKQLISIYYLMALKEPAQLPVSNSKFAFTRREEGAISCRWITREQLSADEFTLPIDKKVADMLRAEWPVNHQ